VSGFTPTEYVEERYPRGTKIGDLDLNGVMTVILRYYTECVTFESILRQTGCS